MSELEVVVETGEREVVFALAEQVLEGSRWFSKRKSLRPWSCGH